MKAKPSRQILQKLAARLEFVLLSSSVLFFVKVSSFVVRVQQPGVTFGKY